MTSLQMDSLAIAYRDAQGREFTALDVPSLAFAPGEMTAIVGPSGCGKSTLLYGISGLAQARTGHVWWQGADVLALSSAARDAWRRTNVGFVFQDFQLVRELSAQENVLLPARFDHFRVPPALAARAKTLLDDLGVPQRSSVASLSRGEAQRVALARALLRDPPIILADEPTASLDAKAAEGVIARLRDLARKHGKIVICVTHDQALIDASDGRVRLDHGRIATAGAVP